MKLVHKFAEINNLIADAKVKAFAAVNKELVQLYFTVGKYVSNKLKSASWGDAVVAQLAHYLKEQDPSLKGFDKRGISRMVQFYNAYSNQSFVETIPANLLNQLLDSKSPMVTQIQSYDYEADKIVTPLVTQLSWTHHLIILSACKTHEERFFYMYMAIKERWSKRELERQIASAIFERTMLANETIEKAKPSETGDLKNVFKDSYILEFLNLPSFHNENQLQNAIVANLKNFILEFGRDFAFMGQEYKIQVGNQDFFIDLLFYHRTLQCLVVLELKTERFSLEHLAQINFYLEALDRDVKNEKENPSIGILLCKGKDDVVVEYALSRTLNPAMIADYQLALPNKKLLHDKWLEILEMNYK